MRYVDYGDTRIIVTDTLSYDILGYPGIGNSIKIKPVSKKVYIKKTAIKYVADSTSGQNIRFFYNSGIDNHNFGVCVVFCFEYNKYFYFLYDANLYSHIMFYLENNIFSSDCLELSGTFAAPKTTEEKCPHLNYQEQYLFDSEFPPAYGYDLLSIQRYSNHENIIKAQTSINNPAVCSCGYISEFVENYPGYKCPQCKIWKKILA